MRQAAVVIPFAGNMRPRSLKALTLAEEAFRRLTDAPMVGGIKFDGYDPARAARYVATFEDA